MDVSLFLFSFQLLVNLLRVLLGIFSGLHAAFVRGTPCGFVSDTCCHRLGYVVDPPYQQTNFRSYNYPNALDSQVTGLNDKKTVVGFYRDAKNNVRGFVNVSGIWSNYRHPRGLGEGKSVTELLGVNNSDVAVGFYTNSSGVNEAFSLNLVTGKYHAIDPPGGTNAVATSIAGRGDIVGYLEKSSQHVGFLLRLGTFTEFTYPGATDTKFLGVTVYDQIVGSYVASGGSTHGFLLTEPLTRVTGFVDGVWD